jgi:hypothetical protein
MEEGRTTDVEGGNDFERRDVSDAKDEAGMSVNKLNKKAKRKSEVAVDAVPNAIELEKRDGFEGGDRLEGAVPIP